MQIRSRHLPSLFLAIFSGLGVLLTLGGGMFLLFSSLLSLARPGPIPNSASLPGNDLLLASGLLFCALLLLPSVVFSFRALQGKIIQPASIRPIRLWQVIVLLALWFAAMLLGGWLGNTFKGSWLVMPLFYLPAIVLPVLILLRIGLGCLPRGSCRENCRR